MQNVMKFRYKKIMLSIIFLFCSLPAYPWWEIGHRLVAQIAYERLTPEAKTMVDSLVPVLARDYPVIRTFIDLAPWPDTLRKQKIELFTHWHYIDLAFSLDGTPINIVVDTDNANRAVLEILPVLENADANSNERARFLAFFVHIVGDLHQPLHNATAVSKETPNGDQGGNLFMILNPENNSEIINLHHLWDSAFGLYTGLVSPDIHQLALAVTTQYPESYFGNKANDLNPEHWSLEGLDYAQKFVYQTNRNQILSNEYQIRGKEIVSQQIALAGYRLAKMLNKLSSTKQPK